MPYIDRCKLLKDLCTTAAPTPSERWIIEKCIAKVNEQPSADVVPKSEPLFYTEEEIMKSLKDVGIEVSDKSVCEIKADVAREIFEEIEKLSHRFMNDEHYIFGDMVWDIAELKKKYIQD